MKSMPTSLAAGSLFATLAFAQPSQYKPTDLGPVGPPLGQPYAVAANGLAIDGHPQGVTIHEDRISNESASAVSTKRYAAASVRALAELQCRLYPTGGAHSAAFTVFTDDDGYAPFHAVGAAAEDAKARFGGAQNA